MSEPIRYCVLTISDRCSAGEAQDLSGPALVESVGRSLKASCIETGLVPDEQAQIAATLRRWAEQSDAPDLVLTTGGTGLAPRDVTPEATASVIERRHDALLELARARCVVKTPLTYLSRGIAGAARGTLIINLPGSPKGAVETAEALFDVLPHAIETLRGKTMRPQDHRL